MVTKRKSSDLSTLSDDELAAELGRRKKTAKRYRIREYEVDEETFHRMTGKGGNGGEGDDDDDDDDDDDADDDDDDDKGAKGKKRRGFFD